MKYLCIVTLQNAWQLFHGQTVTVSSAGVIHENATTYNLDVETTDSFFVWSNGAAVLVHNAVGNVYPYGNPDPAAPVGQSQYYKKINGQYIAQFTSKGTPVMKTNEAHHFFYDAWMKENWQGSYFSRKSPFPCIELSYLDHKLAHDAGRDWFAQNHPLGRLPEGAEWKQVSRKQMEQAATHMMKSISLDPKKLLKLKQQAAGFMNTKLKAGGCMKP